MNNTPTPLLRFRQSWFSTSKAYRQAQLLGFALFLSFYLIYSLPFLNLAQHNVILIFSIRYTLEAGGFILLSHFLLRPALKQAFQRGISLKSSLAVSGWLIGVSVLLALSSFYLSKIPYFDITDFSTFTLIEKDQAQGVQMQVSQLYLFVMLAFMHLSLFLLWALLYLAWQMHLSRKALEQEMQQARLQQLTNQLSPHFLFNTLNSIRALIFEDQHKAADTLTQLSELFRVHLQAHLRPSTSLQEEWALCQTFLHIEQIRLEQRLKLNVSIDKTLWQQPLPTLLLLTLLENAIKHGISPNPEPGEVNLIATAEADHWRIIIGNTMGAKTQQSSTGTGLQNCRKRLWLMYGSKASITISQSTDTFNICLELPYVSHSYR